MRQLYTTKRKSLTVTYSTSATVCSDILHNASFMMWCWYVGSKTTSVSQALCCFHCVWIIFVKWTASNNRTWKSRVLSTAKKAKQFLHRLCSHSFNLIECAAGFAHFGSASEDQLQFLTTFFLRTIGFESTQTTLFFFYNQIKLVFSPKIIFFHGILNRFRQ